MSNRVEQRGNTVDQEMNRMLIPWLTRFDSLDAPRALDDAAEL